MLAVLVSIIVAARVKSLKIVLAVGFIAPILFFVLPFFATVSEPNVVSLALSLPLSLLAAFITFKKAEKRRRLGIVKTRKEKIISLIGAIIILGMLSYLGYLVIGANLEIY